MTASALIWPPLGAPPPPRMGPPARMTTMRFFPLLMPKALGDTAAYFFLRWGGVQTQLLGFAPMAHLHVQAPPPFNSGTGRGLWQARQEPLLLQIWQCDRFAGSREATLQGRMHAGRQAGRQKREAHRATALGRPFHSPVFSSFLAPVRSCKSISF